MKISKIKKKLDKLFGIESEDNNEDMKMLVNLLKEKETKFIDRLVLTENEDEVQAIKQKVSLIKKQIKKAEQHIELLSKKD